MFNRTVLVKISRLKEAAFAEKKSMATHARGRRLRKTGGDGGNLKKLLILLLESLMKKDPKNLFSDPITEAIAPGTRIIDG